MVGKTPQPQQTPQAGAREASPMARQQGPAVWGNVNSTASSGWNDNGAADTNDGAGTAALNDSWQGEESSNGW
ncbi:hypothetical protein MRX96_019007 [Rhipicephalus microplus]